MIPIYKFINTDKLLDKLELILCKTDFDNSQYAGKLLGRYRSKDVVLTKYFGEAKKGLFEGLEVNIPVMSHQLQTALYGDYMKLPTKENIVAHNVKVLYCRKIK